jgi:rare lipoprotein A
MGVYSNLRLYSVCFDSKLGLSPELHPCYSGEKTANGEYAHATAFTAAHRTPALRHLRRGHQHPDRTVRNRPHQRPRPFIAGRVIDLTPAVAKAIGSAGLAHVELTVLGKDRAPRGPP